MEPFNSSSTQAEQPEAKEVWSLLSRQAVAMKCTRWKHRQMTAILPYYLCHLHVFRVGDVVIGCTPNQLYIHHHDNHRKYVNRQWTPEDHHNDVKGCKRQANAMRIVYERYIEIQFQRIINAHKNNIKVTYERTFLQIRLHQYYPYNNSKVCGKCAHNAISIHRQHKIYMRACKLPR